MDAEWEGAVRFSTPPPPTLTPAPSTASDREPSPALQPRPQGPARTPEPRSGRHPAGADN
eukprot:bmy_15396T0